MIKKILIVDDNNKNLDLFQDFVESWGYATITASHGREAISLARLHLPDVILLDVMLPGMSGYEVCRDLKEHVKTQNIPIIMVTVLDDIADRVHGYKIGADHFLVKPVDYNELRAILKNLIGKKEALEEMETREQVVESLGILLRQMLPHEQKQVAARKLHYCQKLCTSLNLSKNELEQGLLIISLQDIFAVLCKHKGTLPATEKDFLQALNLSKWAQPLLEYIRGYKTSIALEVMAEIRARQLERLASISLVLDRYGSLLVTSRWDDELALRELQRESEEYFYPQEVVQLLQQIIKDELFMQNLSKK